MNRNILLIGVWDDKVKSIAEILSKRLGMMHLDIDELVDYNLVNKSRLALAGRQYFDQIQRSSLKQANECTNTIASISLELFSYQDYVNILSSYYIIFIDFTAEQISPHILEMSKDKQLEMKNRLSVLTAMSQQLNQDAHITIKYQDDKQTIDEIILRVKY